MAIYYCPRCGGTNILQDAYVALNDPEDIRLFDMVICDDCGVEVEPERRGS